MDAEYTWRAQFRDRTAQGVNLAAQKARPARFGDGANGQDTKAAMVGWLPAEAVKADVGMYAKANYAFLTDLADGARFAVDLVGVYGKRKMRQLLNVLRSPLPLR